MRSIDQSQLLKTFRACCAVMLFAPIVWGAVSAWASQSNRTETHVSSRRTTPRKKAASLPGKEDSQNPNSLERINSRADFDLLARVYYRGPFHALAHVMFVIDRRSRDRVYYVNSRAYQFHRDFVNATYLSLERGRAFYDNNLLKTDRRFILGTIAYQTAAVHERHQRLDALRAEHQRIETELQQVKALADDPRPVVVLENGDTRVIVPVADRQPNRATQPIVY